MIKWNKILIVIFTTSVILQWVSGCSKRTFTTDSTYAEEMQRFIVDSEDGRELFNPNIFSGRSFYPHYDSLHLYFYTIDSSRRSIGISVGNKPVDIFPFESIYDALGTVRDTYYGHLNRVVGNDTVPAYKVTNSLTRYAYFLKLYNDYYEYRGWRFWGFVGGNYNQTAVLGGRIFGPPGHVTWPATPPESPPIPGSGRGYYINDDSIPKFPLGDSLILLTNVPDILLTEKGDSGIGAINAVPFNTRYMAGWRIPSASAALYHLILFDVPGQFKVDTLENNSVESTLIKTFDYVIPYKVDI